MSTKMDLSTELAAVKALLKEQTQQMAEMASMMKSMMSFAMPLLEEQAHKLCMEKEAEAARKKAVEERAAKKLEQERAAKVEAEKRAKLWSCPNDGCVYPWTYKGTKYLRNSDNQVWREEAYGGCGNWCGVYLIDEDRIDDSVEEPDFE